MADPISILQATTCYNASANHTKHSAIASVRQPAIFTTPTSKFGVKMRAPEVHSILRKTLGPTMKNLGFRRAEGKTACWYRAEPPNAYLFAYAYLSWTGFSEEYGNWFRIEFGVSPDKHRRHITSVWEYSCFLSDEEKTKLLRLRNAVIADVQKGTTFSAWTSDSLEYYGAEHVQRYANALKEILPRLIERFDERPT